MKTRTVRGTSTLLALVLVSATPATPAEAELDAAARFDLLALAAEIATLDLRWLEALSLDERPRVRNLIRNHVFGGGVKNPCLAVSGLDTPACSRTSVTMRHACTPDGSGSYRPEFRVTLVGDVYTYTGPDLRKRLRKGAWRPIADLGLGTKPSAESLRAHEFGAHVEPALNHLLLALSVVHRMRFGSEAECHARVVNLYDGLYLVYLGSVQSSNDREQHGILSAYPDSGLLY